MTGPPILPPNWLRRYVRLRCFEDAVRVERFVAEILERVAVQYVRARFRDDLHHAAGGEAELGFGSELVTLNSSTASSGRSCRGSPSSTQLLIVPSTMLPVPLNVIDPPTLTVAKKERVASTVVPGTSSASDRVLARVDRQRLNLLPRHDAGNFGLGRVDHRRLGGDRQRFGDALQFQREIAPQFETDGDDDVAQVLGANPVSSTWTV